MRMRVRRNKGPHRGSAPRAVALNARWSMDFVHDQLGDKRAFRVLTVVDNWSRESVLLEAGFRLTRESVAAVLSRACETASATALDHCRPRIRIHFQGHGPVGMGERRSA
jgi:putative transposase